MCRVGQEGQGELAHLYFFRCCRLRYHVDLFIGQVYATATEDMDALTFSTPKLLRKFTSSQGKDKQPIVEVTSLIFEIP